MNKNIFISILLIAGAFAGLNAQNTRSTVDNLSTYAQKASKEGWTHSGLANLTFGQTTLDNWSAGGDKWTVNTNFLLNFNLNYLRNRWFWDNLLEAEYGMMNSESNGARKASDRLNFNSVGGMKFSDKWAFSALLNFRTQFADGYNYPNTDNYISKIMAPAYLDFALGFTWKPKPQYSLFLSPIAERATFVVDDSLSATGAYGVKPGKKTLFETGAYVMGKGEQTLAKDLKAMSTLYLFTPYNERFGTIDVNWNLLLNYSFNKFLSASLNLTLRYYENESNKLQLKEILGAGLTYSF
jgi:hypothetical protein